MMSRFCLFRSAPKKLLKSLFGSLCMVSETKSTLLDRSFLTHQQVRTCFLPQAEGITAQIWYKSRSGHAKGPATPEDYRPLWECSALHLGLDLLG